MSNSKQVEFEKKIKRFVFSNGESKEVGGVLKEKRSASVERIRKGIGM